MANLKISQLTPGAPAQATDLLPIDRAGANYSLKISDAGAQILTSPNVSKSITTGLNALGNVSGTPVFDLSLGNVISLTLAGNVTSSTFSNGIAAVGEEITFIISQDGTGGRTFAWPTSTAGKIPAVNPLPLAVTVVKGVFDGTNLNFIGNGAVVVFYKVVTGQVVAEGLFATIYTCPVAGFYRVAAVLIPTTASSSACTIALQIKTALNGQASGSTINNYALSAATIGTTPTNPNTYTETLVEMAAAGAIQTSTILSSGSNTGGAWSYYIVIEQF